MTPRRTHITGGRSRDDRLERSLARLRDELRDDEVPIRAEGDLGRALLEEIHYARSPRIHERDAPSYGSMTFRERPSSVDAGPGASVLVEIGDVPLAVARRFADGRGSFLIRDADGPSALACFGSSVQFEATLVALEQQTRATVVQRTQLGTVKVFAGGSVVTWTGANWVQKPYSSRFADVIRRLVPGCDRELLGGLLELSVHWLSSGFHGATIVWSLASDVDAIGHVDDAAALPAPPLSLRDPSNFAAALSAISQTDGAALVDPGGTLVSVGATLKYTDRAAALIPAALGTRHTSARWFSFAEPSTLVFVVSEDGPVSVYSTGARAALVRADTSAPLLPHETAPLQRPWEGEEIRECERCAQPLLVDRAADSSDGEEEQLYCAVCAASIGTAPAGSVVRGVRRPALGPV